jgi:hypothetical protein
MKNFSTAFTTTKTAIEAYNAIGNFRGWWSQSIEGNTNIPGETFFYHYKDVHLCKLQLMHALPGKKLVYKVVDNHFNFTKHESEWKNSSLIFEIDTNDGITTVTFTHQGLDKTQECYHICKESWMNYINKSLHQLIETGQGNPNPKVGEGFNAAIVKKWKLKSV